MTPVYQNYQILMFMLITVPIHGVDEESISQHQSQLSEFLQKVKDTPYSVILTIALVGAMAVVLIWYINFYSRLLLRSVKRHNNFLKNGGSFVDAARSKHGVTTERFRLYTPEEIEKITDGFNTKRILGTGSQGKVFKGMLDNGDTVAIKRANNVDKETRERFIEEAAVLSNINHPHIIKLLGICLLSDYPMLVYKFHEGGDLYNYIKGFIGKTSRSWVECQNILRNVADALSSMHGFPAMGMHGICHRDVKLDNILVDDKEIKNGYVADFGVSKYNESEGAQPLESAIGTFGYFDPVIWREMTYAKESDVYSYGVVVAQLLTGKCATNEDFMNGFIRNFIKDVHDGNKGGTFDPLLPFMENKKELWRVARVACACLRESRAERPAMADVSEMLWGSKALPKKYNDVQLPQQPVALLTGSSRSGSSFHHSVPIESSRSGSSSSSHSLSDEEAMLRTNA